MTHRSRVPLIADLQDLDRTARADVGMKAANLGELLHAGISVPPGFVVLPAAFELFLTDRTINRTIQPHLRALSTDNARVIETHGRALQALLRAAPLPAQLLTELRSAYTHLVVTGGSPLVAVRSSVVVLGQPDERATAHSATFLNVHGADAVATAVQHAWVALTSPAALADWQSRGIDPAQVSISVVVQRMVTADCAGVLYTADPVTGSSAQLVIEAVRGLGQALTGGLLTPDRYIIDRASLAIVERSIAPQTWQLARAHTDATGLAGTQHVSVPVDQRAAAKVTDEQLTALAQLGLQIAERFGGNQDIEWAIEGDKLWIVEARPVPSVTRTVTVQSDKTEAGSSKPETEPKFESNGSPNSSLELSASAPTPLARGASGSLGTASGIARIVQAPDDFKRVKAGDVIVTELTTLNLTPILVHAGALVTDTGGRTSHAAIAGREHGLPVVVGTGTGTHAIKDGQMVTVDGTAGVVYAGKQTTVNRERGTGNRRDTQYGDETRSQFTVHSSLGTKLYAILSDPAQAEAVATQPVDGVGLLRAEFMIAGLGEHPAAMEAAGRGGEFTQKLAAELTKFAAAFAPRPVIYRTSDFKSNEYRSLTGGEAFEPHEENPMLGYRGVARYLAEPRLFRRELDAIKQVRTDHANVWLMLPFVRTVEELTGALKLINDAGLERSRDFRIQMMCELPSNVILLEQFLDAGIDGISIGSNDLTQLILGIDRDNQRLASEFDERDPAVSKAIEYVIKTCRSRHVPVSLCGQAPSEHPDFAEKLVEWGITSISVNPDVIESTRALIASIEHHQNKHAALINKR